MQTFRTIMDAWPSRSAFAADLGISPQATTNMYRRNSIPANYWLTVVSAAATRSIRGVTMETLAGLAHSKSTFRHWAGRVPSAEVSDIAV